jgi:hypothetical protein
LKGLRVAAIARLAAGRNATNETIDTGRTAPNEMNDTQLFLAMGVPVILNAGVIGVLMLPIRDEERH